MSVVTGALGSLAPKLLQLLGDEYKLQKGVKKQVQWVSIELDNINAFFRKVSAVPWDRLDELVKLWAREIREASYDMEDVLDTFLVQVDGGAPADPSRLKLTLKKMSKVFSKAKARRGIAGAIEDIKKRLDDIAERRQRYKLDEMIAAAPTIDPRLIAMYKEVSQLIGVDKSREDIISMLNLSQPDDDAPDKITKKVSIVGVGGLGKTTLAKAVYENLKSQFDCAAFVSVGRDLDLVKVFKDILFDLDKEEYKDIHETKRGLEFLIREVREFLENKRYFIVVDDVWEVEKWKKIEVAFIENNCGSRVITTTRSVNVAKASGEVYKLKPLSDDDSMNLFYTRIFGADRKFLGNQQDDISEKILKKCAGIPLAIITMGSLFAGKEKHQWSMLFNSIGFVHGEDNNEVKDTMTILSLSYYDLPPELRTCLLYLSTYPEDYEIEKDPLIWKWIAEGFINPDKGKTLYEIGEKYFNDLINRSLIQVVEAWDGRVSGCRIHDMVLDMIRKLAFEENFIALVGENVEATDAASSVRRLVQQNRRAEHKISEATVTEMTKVRSYSTFLCCINNRDQFLRFKILRVLDIVGCSFDKGCHLDHLGDLLHLRYLGMRRCGGTGYKIPKQIGNLKLLQTIDVDVVLPESIFQVSKLVRLHAPLLDTQDGIGNLTSLQELEIKPRLVLWDIPKRFIKELGRLRELRVLKFSSMKMEWELGMQRDFVESLCNLKNIQHIDVNVSFPFADNTAMLEAAGFVLPRSICYLALPVKFSKMPSFIDPSSLRFLFHLNLFVTTMDEHDLKLLARLPALCYLKLRTESTVTASNINAGDGCFFQKLRHLWTESITVQFEQPNEKDGSVSFHMWNYSKQHAMPFVSRKSNDSSKSVVPRGVMPNLENLRFEIPLKAIKDNNGDYGSFGLEYLPSIRKLSGPIDCEGVSAKEVDAALAALRNACKVHPNNPTFEMYKINDPVRLAMMNRLCQMANKLNLPAKFVTEQFPGEDLETASDDD
ncbi:hypothetical protein BDA96_05G224000 [Sorghum bicolor]|uniref:AAA+ ATPase domain-containing protein n=1 Tax=Sorghum bicolor TaxID=4558 RepID=A0A921QZH8_SORBI|nr:hypothetical protein BDA96_05G224000 [Sorghum bicolor]